MKFGKYLENNKVPEWHDKYVEYKQLRKAIKRFKNEIETVVKSNPTNDNNNNSQNSSTNNSSNNLNTLDHPDGGGNQSNTPPSGVELRRTFSSIILNKSNLFNPLPITTPSSPTPQQQQQLSTSLPNPVDLQLLLINQKQILQQPQQYQSLYTQYQSNQFTKTTLTRLQEIQEEFISLIIGEAEKVNAFYKERELEAINRFNQIYNQVEYLIKLRNKEKKQKNNNNINSNNNNNNNNNNEKNNNIKEKDSEEEKEELIQNASILINDKSMEIDNQFEETSAIISIREQEEEEDEEEEEGNAGASNDEDHKEKDGIIMKRFKNEEETEGEEGMGMVGATGGVDDDDDEKKKTKKKQQLFKKITKEVQDKIINNYFLPLENKAKNWIKLEKLKNDESTLKEIILEYYKFLNLLKNYKVFNYTGFIKILKKAEKNLELNLNDLIINRLNQYEFKSSKLIDKFSNLLEKIYSQLFTNNKIRDARKQMRNRHPNSNAHVTTNVVVNRPTVGTSNRSSFFSGICVGWTSAILILIYYILYTGEYEEFVRFSTVYNLYSTLGLLILWCFMFGIDLYIWTKSHVHYSFIFEVSKTKLNFAKVFQSVTVLAVLWITSIGFYMWSSLSLDGDVSFPFPFFPPPEYLPLFLLGIYLVMLFFPGNFFQFNLRKWFLKTCLTVIIAPFKPVKFSHFFMGDQLSSLVLVLVQFSQFICFYTTDVYHPSSEAVCGRRSRYFTPFISAAPATWRFLQCLRRYRDSNGDMVHLRNALKYFISMVMVFNSTMDSFYSTGWSSPWRIIWLVSACCNSLYSYWWDLFMDWSIIQIRNGSIQIRKKRMYSPSFIYYFAIISNFGFRMTWAMTKSLPQLATFLPSYKLVVVIGIVEIIRRGQWNIYRLENEHLNNCGKFRCTRDIPLPFIIDNDNDNDEDNENE